MPDLANLSFPSSLTITAHCLSSSVPASPGSSKSNESVCPESVKTLVDDGNLDQELRFQADEKVGHAPSGDVIKVFKRRPLDRAKRMVKLEDHVRAWVKKKVENGVPESRCFLPFLNSAKRMEECLLCHKFIDPGEEVRCSVRDCRGVYHSSCAKENLGGSNFRKFKCPQHECFICKQRVQWRCVRCITATHDKHAPWLDEVIHLENQSGRAICWRHPTNWRLDKKHALESSNMEEVFCQLPWPYVDEEFKIDLLWKDLMNKDERPQYIHIRRNIYLTKKKRDRANDGVGCTSCSTTCCQDCVCRVQYISCSKLCQCLETCSNRPFRKEKKIKIVKTELCGWGVEAAEPINKGEFVIEYIGEVIDDALCEQRLWDMKYRGLKNFYMCEIRKDFTIDATFKGNASRFLNHSCDPNCVLEKWQVEGETRVGVFAARQIEVGEPLTYDYRFVQFGPEENCYCGSKNCQGYLGTKRKATVTCLDVSWGSKRRRVLSTDYTVIHHCNPSKEKKNNSDELQVFHMASLVVPNAQEERMR